MELSPQNQFSQVPQPTHIEIEQKSHILRQEESQDGTPEIIASNIKTGEPLATFDYEAALKMTEPSPIFQSSPVASSLEDEVRLERESVPSIERPRILRPNSLKVAEERKKWGMMETVQAATMSAVMGVAGAGMSSNAEAQVIGTQQFEKQAAVSVVNGLLNVFENKIGAKVGIPGAVVKETAPGKFETVTKTPQELAVNVSPRISPETMSYAQAIGVNIIDRGGTVFVENAKNPAENLTFKRFENSEHYMVSLSIEKANGGGLRITTSWEQKDLQLNQMVRKTQLITVRTFENGRMGAVFVGDR